MGGKVQNQIFGKLGHLVLRVHKKLQKVKWRIFLKSCVKQERWRPLIRPFTSGLATTCLAIATALALEPLYSTSLRHHQLRHKGLMCPREEIEALQYTTLWLILLVHTMCALLDAIAGWYTRYMYFMPWGTWYEYQNHQVCSIEGFIHLHMWNFIYANIVRLFLATQTV